MATNNPYETSADVANPPELPRGWRSSARGASIGFLIGAALPVGMGMSQLHQISVYNASLPPGTGTCGNAALGAACMIFFFGPFGGLVGGLSGAMVGGFFWRTPSRPQ